MLCGGGKYSSKSPSNSYHSFPKLNLSLSLLLQLLKLLLLVLLLLQTNDLEFLKIGNFEHCSHKEFNYEQDVQINNTNHTFLNESDICIKCE